MAAHRRTTATPAGGLVLVARPAHRRELARQFLASLSAGVLVTIALVSAGLL